MEDCAFPLYMYTNGVFSWTPAYRNRGEGGSGGRFCSRRQAENKILGYLFVAESVVIT